MDNNLENIIDQIVTKNLDKFATSDLPAIIDQQTDELRKEFSGSSSGGGSTDLTRVNSRLSSLETSVSQNTTNLATVTSNVSSLKTDNEANKSDISTLKSDNETNKSDIASLKTDNTTNKTDIATLKSDVSILKSDVATAKTDISTLKQQMTTAQSDISTLKSDVQGIQTNLETVMSNIATLQNSVGEMSDYGSRITALENAGGSGSGDGIVWETIFDQADSNLNYGQTTGINSSYGTIFWDNFPDLNNYKLLRITWSIDSYAYVFIRDISDTNTYDISLSYIDWNSKGFSNYPLRLIKHSDTGKRLLSVGTARSVALGTSTSSKPHTLVSIDGTYSNRISKIEGVHI